MTQYILVAGENENNLELAKQVVDGLDYEIVKAPSMSLALYLAQKNSPIAILSGAELTDGDPHTLACAMKKDPDLAPIPLIFLLPKDSDLSLKYTLLEEGAQVVLTNAAQAKQFLVDLIAAKEAQS